jgi:hypothetical protein
MKLYLFILSTFLFLPVLKITAQLNTPVEKESKVSIGLVQSANVSYRFSRSIAEFNWMKNGLDSIEKPLVCYSTALLFKFNIKNRLQLNTGVSYSKIGYQYKEGSLIGFKNYQETFNIIEVPIQVSYKLTPNKSYAYMSLGVSPGYIFSSRAAYLLENENDWKSMELSSDYSKFQLNASLSFGGSFKLDNSWDLKTELFYNQYVLSLSEGPIEKRLFSAGLSVGLFKRF